MTAPLAAGGAIPFGEAKPAGPLASFECVDVWVEHPYRDGVALLGDSAASNDPSWGQGLSLSFRDARVLSDELLGNEDWSAAGHTYAAGHDQHYGVVGKVTGWFYDVFQRLGPMLTPGAAEPCLSLHRTRRACPIRCSPGLMFRSLPMRAVGFLARI